MLNPIRRVLPSAPLSTLPSPAPTQPLTAVIDTVQSAIAYTGHSLRHRWTGTSHTVTGHLAIDPEDPEDPDAGRFTVTAPIASFDSGNRRRDAKMQRTVESKRYPTVRFTADRGDVTTWAAEGDTVASTMARPWRARLSRANAPAHSAGGRADPWQPPRRAGPLPCLAHQLRRRPAPPTRHADW